MKSAAITIAAFSLCLLGSGCKKQNALHASADAASTVKAHVLMPPPSPAPSSILDYTKSLMFDASIRGNELRLVMQKSSNHHHATQISADVYQLHVEGLCMCVIGKLKCDWTGEPINRISFLDADDAHGFSFSGGETECRLIGEMNAAQSAAFIRQKTTRL